MTKKTYDTEDWKLGCFLEWQPKNHTEVCDNCNGRKMVGGGFKSIDDAIQCYKCFGSGILTVSPKTLKPEIPADLREHLRRAWFDYFNA